jgi:hypothetical protein
MQKDYMLRYRYDGGVWKPYHVYPSYPTTRQIASCRKYVQARKPYKRVDVDVRTRRKMHV